MVLVKRDYVIMSELDRWRFCLGRHIQAFAGFSGERACNRRLKILLQARYIERQKVLYGVPYIYQLAHRGKMLIGANKRKDKIRIAQIAHDIALLDIAVYAMSKYQLVLSDIQTEKQLHSLHGFSIRKHCPDFVFEKDSKKYCVEIELSQKPIDRLIKILKSNFELYDTQIYFIKKTNQKLFRILQNNLIKYPNIEIQFLEDILTI